MVYFVGAGPGAPDLITLRGARLLGQAGTVVWAGSLVNPALLELCAPACQIHDSAAMALEEIIGVLVAAHNRGETVVRLQTGDLSIFGALAEQAALLDRENIPWEVVPGVSSFLGAAASIGAEYTLPGVSQTVILTRAPGRTPVPENQRIRSLAAHGASMAIFLSATLLEDVSRELQEGGLAPGSPAALIYKATWEDEQVVRTTVDKLPEVARQKGINSTALVLAGGFLSGNGQRSKLYDQGFSHGFRKGDTAQ